MQQIGVYQTDGDGKLELETHNQEAVFTGITVGTPYEVTETPKADGRARTGGQCHRQYIGDGSTALLTNSCGPKRSLTVKKDRDGRKCPGGRGALSSRSL